MNAAHQLALIFALAMSPVVIWAVVCTISQYIFKRPLDHL